MKKIIGFAVCLALAATVCKGEGFEDWFTPSGGFTSQPSFDVWISVGGYEDSIQLAITSDIDEIGYWVDMFSAGIPVTAKNAFETAKAALISAMYAQCQAKLNECKINNLASAIEGIVVASYGEYHDQAGRVISKSKANIARDQLLRSKNSIVAGNSATEGTKDDPLVVEVLETPFSSQTFEQDTRKEGESKTILKGVPALTEVSGSSFPFSSGLYLATGWLPLMTSKDGELTWKAWNGVDTDVLGVSAGTGGRDGKLGLKDWNGGNGGCDLNLKGLLTNKDDPDYQAARNSHTIMTRCNDNGTYKLHYMSVGGLIDSLTAIEPDEVSIETHINDDGTTNLCVYGFNEANKAVAKGEKKIGLIPCANGGDKLAWAGLSEFFSDKVFNTTESGKIILNGVSEEGSDKVRVLAVKGSGDGQEVGTVAFDNASVDGNIETAQVVQMHNFSTAPSPYGGYSTFNFADALTNNSATISGMSIPVRYPNGNRVEIGYIPMGKVTGIPSASVDNLTIEASKDNDAADNEPDKLRIVGSKDATKGQLLKMGDGGKVEWGDFPIDVDRPEGLAQDRYPLYITAADPEKNEPAKIGINGWETTDSPEGLYGAGNGKPVTYRFADIHSLEADGELRTIELAGYVNAGNYSMAFKGIENGLGWVAPPSSGSALLTMNHGAEPTVTVLGNSVETETINNKVTLNIKGFTNGGGCDTTMSAMMTKDEQSANRSNHQVLTRYSDGSGTPALHWVPMGDKVQASGGGGAFKFYGNTGTSATTPVVVGSGSTTNAVRFASASDSNVQVSCESDGNGGVTVTIGVYYR